MFNQGMDEFMAKPVQCLAATVSSATQAIGSVQIPDAHLSDSMVLEKLNGYLGYRGVYVVKGKVNANVCQAGVMVISWIPFSDVLNTDWRRNHMTTITQLPHCFLNIACESEFEIELPYITPLDYYDLSIMSGRWGTLYFDMLLPLTYGTGSSNFGITAYVYVKQGTLELLSPTLPLLTAPMLKKKQIMEQNHKGKPPVVLIKQGGSPPRLSTPPPSPPPAIQRALEERRPSKPHSGELRGNTLAWECSICRDRQYVHIQPHQRDTVLFKTTVSDVLSSSTYTCAPCEDKFSTSAKEMADKFRRAAISPERSPTLFDTHEELSPGVFRHRGNAGHLDFTGVPSIPSSAFVPPVPDNPKNQLQEYCQKHRLDLPHYTTKSTTSPSGTMYWYSEVRAAGKALTGPSKHTKVEAELAAAELLLRGIKAKITPHMKATVSKKNAGKSPSDQEKKQQSGGPISKIADKIATIASHFTAVPDLNMVAIPLMWSAKVVSCIASKFGFSNQMLDTNPMYVVVRPGRGQACCDVPSTAEPLTLMRENQVQLHTTMGGTSQDEMSIAFIQQKYAYWSSFTLSTADTADEELMVIDLCPGTFYNSVTETEGQFYYFTPLSYICQDAMYYRGDIKFRLRWAKTEQHQASIRIVFVPGTGIANVATINDVQYCHTTILDISEGDVFEFQLPFVSPTNYLYTWDEYGKLYFYVVNPLRCTDIVSSSVMCAIEVCAADNFEVPPPYEWNIPNNFWLPVNYPVIGRNPEADKAKKKPPKEMRKLMKSRRPSKPHMLNNSVGGANPMCVSSVPLQIGGAKSSPASMYPAEMCQGERWLSIRQLIKRPTMTHTDPIAYTDSIFRPRAIGQAYYNTGTSAWVFPAGCYDAYARYAQMYAFYRGGVILKAVPSGVPYPGSYQAWVTFDSTNTDGFLQPTVIPGTLDPHAGGVAYFETPGGPLEVRAPHCAKTAFFPVLPFTTTGINEDYFNDDVCVQFKGSSSTQMTFCYLRAGADDAQFGYFLGVPPQYYAEQSPASLARRVKERDARPLQREAGAVSAAPGAPLTQSASSAHNGLESGLSLSGEGERNNRFATESKRTGPVLKDT